MVISIYNPTLAVDSVENLFNSWLYDYYFIKLLYDLFSLCFTNNYIIWIKAKQTKSQYCDYILAIFQLFR